MASFHRVLKKQFHIFYLLVVQFLGLPWFEELQQVPQSSLIIVSERIPWTVPVPGHQPPGRGGGQGRVGVEKDKRRDRMEGEKRKREGRRRGGRGRMSVGEGPEAGIKGKQQEKVGGDRLCNISIINCKQF